MTGYKKYRIAGELDSTITGKLLYLMLLDVVDEKEEVTISYRRISETLGINRSTVSRNFRRLYIRGFIDIVPQFHSDGGRKANKIKLL